MKEKHNLTKKHPIIAILLLLLVAVLVISGSSTIILMFARAFRLVDTSQISLVTNAAMPIFSILFMIIMKAWYSPEYKGTLKSGLSGKDTFFVCLPFIIYGVIVLVVQLIQYNFYFKPTLGCALLALTAGFSEEVFFRVTVIPVALGFMKSKNRIWIIPIVTALLFGASHLSNISSGATMTNTLVQTISSAMAGFYFGVLFVCTGSAIPGIIMHCIYDFIGFAGDPSLNNGIMVSTMSTWEIVYFLIVTLLLSLCGIVMLKKIGYEKIQQVWNKKWSIG